MSAHRSSKLRSQVHSSEHHEWVRTESAPCASDITDPINMLMFPRYACRLTPATLSGLLIALCSGFGSVQAKYSYDIATKYDIGDSDSPRYELIGTVSNTSIRLHAPGLLIQLPRDPVFINVACFPPDVVHPHDLALIVKFLNEMTTVHGRVDVLRARLWVWDNLATRYPVENQRLLVTAQIIGMKAAILAMGLALPLWQSTGRPVLHDGES
ncbi:hypothetical protein PBRA_009385 [Plasmodiophora brassicae]|uniref:Uncharacterized protein n=1 Tax=Plasmodiophora brassicae TaxID=37360 RepID=A0A0G4J7D3_PLABS|nr:hypothetical protein PBRA_009385 [Plasmodiophora brassicae]